MFDGGNSISLDIFLNFFFRTQALTHDYEPANYNFRFFSGNFRVFFAQFPVYFAKFRFSFFIYFLAKFFNFLFRENFAFFAKQIEAKVHQKANISHF